MSKNTAYILIACAALAGYLYATKKQPRQVAGNTPDADSGGAWWPGQDLPQP